MFPPRTSSHLIKQIPRGKVTHQKNLTLPLKIIKVLINKFNF